MTRFALTLCLLMLAGCVNQSEMALSNNVYRLDLEASGSDGISVASQTTQRRVAELTLSKGFTHYIIQDVNSEQGAKYFGSSATYTDTRYKWTRHGPMERTVQYGGDPIVVPTAHTTITIVMFRAPYMPPEAIDASWALATSR